MAAHTLCSRCHGGQWTSNHMQVTWFTSFNTLQCNYNCTKERTNWQVITLLICQCFITLWKHDFLSNRMGVGQCICLRCGLIEEFWGIEMKYTGDGEISSPPHKYSFILHVFCSLLQKKLIRWFRPNYWNAPECIIRLWQTQLMDGFRSGEGR